MKDRQHFPQKSMNDSLERERVKRRFAVIALLVALLATPASAGLFDRFKDPETGKFDATHYLLSDAGFAPLPIIITEPAIGFGFGLAPAFFHDFNHPGVKGKDLSIEQKLEYPPSATAGFGAYTTNDSWLAGAGHFGTYRKDTIRYTGVLAYADLKLKFFLFDEPLDFDIKGAFTLQDVKFRIGKSNWFLGAEYTLVGSEVDFRIPSGGAPSPVRPRDLDSANAGLAAQAYYDSRNTIFTPSRGQQASARLTRFDKAVGGDFDYWRLDADLMSFHPVHPRWVVGWRVKGATTSDEPPFYGLPFVWMRGIPAMRYQGDAVAQVEAEGLWNVAGLWSITGFVGYGDTWSDIPGLESGDTILAGGAGFRFNIARQMGFQVGIDVARGPEDWTVYLQFGHAWGR